VSELHSNILECLESNNGVGNRPETANIWQWTWFFNHNVTEILFTVLLIIVLSMDHIDSCFKYIDHKCKMFITTHAAEWTKKSKFSNTVYNNLNSYYSNLL